MEGGLHQQSNGPSNGEKQGFITEVNEGDPMLSGDDDAGKDSDNLDDRTQNMIFNVREAVPPTDYDAPYSQLPESVVLFKVKQRVKFSYANMAKLKAQEIKDKQKKQQAQRAALAEKLGRGSSTGKIQSVSKFGNQSGKGLKSTDADFEEGKLPPIQGRSGTAGRVSEEKKLVAREKKEHWLNLLDEEHADALISDAFWYIICKIMNPKKEFEQHQEFLLDRIAANFVSFTLIEKPGFDDKIKQQFFKKFYDIISQAVYYSLFYAYPKSRKQLNEAFMRQLINEFSEMFTGNQIHSASLAHWNTKAVRKETQTGKKGKDASLADMEIGKSTKSRRERLFMRYSPLVERYLITHNYETINNVRKWKMLLTQRTEIQKDVDKKFKKFMMIANQANALRQQWNEEYKAKCDEVDRMNNENKKYQTSHNEHINTSTKERKENGGYAEFANMITSIHVQKNKSNMDDD